MPDLTKKEETDILLDAYLSTCRNLDRLTEILMNRGLTPAELAVYYKEHRDMTEEP